MQWNSCFVRNPEESHTFDVNLRFGVLGPTLLWHFIMWICYVIWISILRHMNFHFMLYGLFSEQVLTCDTNNDINSEYGLR